MAFDIFTKQLEIVLSSKSTSHNAAVTSLLHCGEEMEDLEKNSCFLNDAEGTANEMEEEEEEEEGRKEGEDRWQKVKDGKLKGQ